MMSKVRQCSEAAPMPPSCSAHWDGLRKKAASPRASGSTWRKPSHRPEGNSVRRGTQIEGSIMDAKTGANIKTGKFVVGDRDTTFPIYEGTIGPSVIDIRKLYAETGMFTYDPGYTSTGSCESKITYIDGDKGILLHRGYPIEELAEKSDFMEVCYLLLNGELPSAKAKGDFTAAITRHTMVHEQLSQFYRGLRRDAHPMAIMCGVVGALSAFYHDSTDITDPDQRMIASHRLIAKMPTLVAMAFKYSLGQPFLYPDNSLTYT